MSKFLAIAFNDCLDIPDIPDSLDSLDSLGSLDVRVKCWSSWSQARFTFSLVLSKYLFECKIMRRYIFI